MFLTDQAVQEIINGYYNDRAKRSQHANATFMYRDIFGHNMFCAFGHPVATCCDTLGVVGPSLKMVINIFKLGATTPNILHPTMLRHVALACCNRLAWA